VQGITRSIPYDLVRAPRGLLWVWLDHVLAGLAEFERHLILSRTNEGRQRAMARGIKFGKKPKLTKHQQAEARTRVASGTDMGSVSHQML
jgi:DNA invertase Pin-like site-specific DNA recombinase